MMKKELVINMSWKSLNGTIGKNKESDFWQKFGKNHKKV
jgi:hypothetical protein